jgi:hypothetical protein
MLMLSKACGLGLYPTQKLIQRVIKILKGLLSSLKKPSSQKRKREREREREREKKLTERKGGEGGGLGQ